MICAGSTWSFLFIFHVILLFASWMPGTAVVTYHRNFTNCYRTVWKISKIRRRFGSDGEITMMDKEAYAVLLSRGYTPGGHYWDYYPGSISFCQVTATHSKISHL